MGRRWPMRSGQPIAAGPGGRTPAEARTAVTPVTSALQVTVVCQRLLGMKIVLDESACTSIGMCESLAPDVFEVDDDGLLLVHEPEPDESRRSEVAAACEACPNSALTIEG